VTATLKLCSRRILIASRRSCFDGGKREQDLILSNATLAQLRFGLPPVELPALLVHPIRES
jgi:hypothetical protein